MNISCIAKFCYVDRFEDKSLVPLRVSSRKVDLFILLLEDGFTHHYVLIANLKTLICSVKKGTNNYKILCRNCFHISAIPDVYVNLRSCLYNEPAIIRMPSENKNKVKSGKYKARWFAPVVIYFHLESLIQPLA